MRLSATTLVVMALAVAIAEEAPLRAWLALVLLLLPLSRHDQPVRRLFRRVSKVTALAGTVVRAAAVAVGHLTPHTVLPLAVQTVTIVASFTDTRFLRRTRLAVLDLAFRARLNTPELVAIVFLCLVQVIPVAALHAPSTLSLRKAVGDRLFLGLETGCRRIAVTVQARRTRPALDAGFLVLRDTVARSATFAHALVAYAAIGHGPIVTVSTFAGLGDGTAQDEQDGERKNATHRLRSTHVGFFGALGV